MKKNVSSAFVIFLILFYTAIHTILLMRHEPWADEAQAWLISRDLDIVSIFKQMAYEGSPALWHMLLVPFAKTSLPYIFEFILHLIIAVAAVTIFVLYAPFSKTTKVLFIFSYYMAYEYSIIARSYSLSILLLFVIAALYDKRFKHPLYYSLLIFLLSNTNVHSFFIASSLSILFVWEFLKYRVQGGRIKIAVFIMFAGGFLCFLQLLSPPDNINYGIITYVTWLAPFVAMAHAFFPWHTIFISNEVRLLFQFISFLIWYVTILSLMRNQAILFIALFSFSGLFYIFMFKYGGGLRHHGFVLIMLLFSLWINRYYSGSHKKLFKITSTIHFSKISILLINVCLALSIPYSLKIQYLEYKYLFSGSREMANFIKKNHLENYIIVAHQSVAASAILPYLPGKMFWYAGIEEYGTFITFNKNYLAGKLVSNEQAITRMEKAFPDRAHILLLLNNPLHSPELYNLRLLHKTEEKVFGYGSEIFYLYEPANQEL